MFLTEFVCMAYLFNFMRLLGVFFFVSCFIQNSFVLHSHFFLFGNSISIAGCSATNSNSSIPCNGHGKCETKENGQSCSCYYGFTGPFCEHSKYIEVYSFFLV